MEGTLKVEPAKLKDTSARFSAKAGEVKALHDEMISKVESTSSAFSGEGGDSYRSKFKTLQTSMDKINRMIMEHSRDLQAMAEEFERAQAAVVNVVNELPQSNL